MNKAIIRVLESTNKYYYNADLIFILCRPEFFYGCGRASQIWRVSPYALHTVPTWRIGELSRHKTLHQNFIQNHPQFVYSCGRESVIWDTSRTATTYPSRPHTTKLAKPKTPHPDYKIPKPVSGHSFKDY